MVNADKNEPAALPAALKQDHFYSSQGPEIRSIHHDDEWIYIACVLQRRDCVSARPGLARSV